MAALLLLGGFAVFTLASRPDGSSAVDSAADRFADRLVPGALEPLVNGVAWLGAPSVSLLLTALLAGLVTVRGQWLAAALVICGMAAMTGIEGAQRLRIAAIPWGDLAGLAASPHGRHLVDSTYPSGHVARVMFLGGVVAMLLPRRVAGAGIAGALLLGSLVAVQRVYGGYHTGSDVVGGLLLGAGTAAVYAALLPRTAAIQRRLAGRLPRLTRPG